MSSAVRVLAALTAACGLEKPSPDSRKIFVTGPITTQTDMATTLVTADGIFVTPDPHHARALFPDLPGEPTEHC
ncbi:hypothetical protein [Streptomyces sp. TRM68367]|uniref:hypothetical protein n=1 Tax=Streptomyces sp. TRM68367 TaxID=2758415 RepID=UPI00165C62AC|nr:hypothetical protein [Streptomyces sp. TRM68367]MBC9730742.1 hypothetical protein [Streptomyces sp. TRM68367]